MERHLERETCAHCGLMPHVVSSRDRGRVVCASPLMRDLLRKAARFAASEAPVVVFGESGTGKEVVARALHANSPRAQQPFVAVNVAALPTELLESELFGHARGAFTGAHQARKGLFESADGGVLFLDEIGEMPLPLQAKLLRALQEGEIRRVGETAAKEVDVRVVCATHRDLAERVRSGHFREDLYYRLNVVNLHLPPLRERGDDVVVLAKYLLNKYAEEFGSKVKGFTPNALIALKKYDWPGNVRQVENRIKKAIVLCDKTLIGPEDLDLFPEALTEIQTLTQAREDFQRRYILEVLERNNGNRTKTARDLGVDPRTIFRYLEREPDAPEPTSGTAKSDP